MKRLPFLVLLCWTLGVQAQTPTPGANPADAPRMYKLSWPVDLTVVGGSIATTAVFTWVDESRPRPTPADVMALDPGTIPAFERAAIYNLSEPIQALSDVGMYTSLAAPCFLYLDPAIRADGLAVPLLAFEVGVVNVALTQTAKVLTQRVRPYMYNPNYPLDDKLADRDGLRSFWSGHTSISASMCYFTAKVFQDYHPHSPWRYVVWGAAATVPAVTAWARVGAGKHFATDVIVGYITGAAIGYLVPVLHKRWAHRKK